MDEDKKIRILIADDQDLVRSGYRAILSTFPDLEIVGMAKDGIEAVELSQQLKPDVVLMDIRMPLRNGIEATRDITENPLLDDTHVLILTTFDLDEYVYDALRAGASGFLLKDADPEEIANAIEVVARGDALIQPSVMRRLVEDFANSAPTGSAANSREGYSEALESLTDREREILELAAKGLNNDQIAEKLFISPATVKTHIARIMGKTSSHDRAQLVVFAYESGLVSAGASSL